MAATAILFVRYAAEVIVPFVLSAMLFYALDPAVDALQRHRVPCWLGALLILGAVIGGAGAGVYALRDSVVKIVADLPDGARRLRALPSASGRPSNHLSSFLRVFVFSWRFFSRVFVAYS